MSIASDALKVPPNDINAEKSVLGSILIDPSAMGLVAEFIHAEYFYLPEHQAIYNAMLSLFEKQSPIDLITMQDQLKADGAIKRIGGAAYLSELINIVPTSANVEQ